MIIHGWSVFLRRFHFLGFMFLTVTQVCIRLWWKGVSFIWVLVLAWIWLISLLLIWLLWILCRWTVIVVIIIIVMIPKATTWLHLFNDDNSKTFQRTMGQTPAQSGPIFNMGKFFKKVFLRFYNQKILPKISILLKKELGRLASGRLRYSRSKLTLVLPGCAKLKCKNLIQIPNSLT